MKYLLKIIATVVIAPNIIISCNNKKEEKPNLVFIIADEWRAQDAGYAGSLQVMTPNLDKLSAEGVSFTTAVATCPVCTPWRATMLTGQYPLTHGVFYNDKPLRDESLTIAEVYKEAGYKTAYIGKWHVNGHKKGESVHDGRTRPVPKERRQGFDFWKVNECTHDYNNSVYFDENNVKHTWEGYDAFAQTSEAIKYMEDNIAN